MEKFKIFLYFLSHFSCYKHHFDIKMCTIKFSIKRNTFQIDDKGLTGNNICKKSMNIIVSPHKELTGFPVAILNDPEKQLEGEGSSHVVHIFQKVPGQPQTFKSLGQGIDPCPSPGHTRTSPTPPWGERGRRGCRLC